MSRIPSSAMPRARPSKPADVPAESAKMSAADRIAGLARSVPGTVWAAGAVVAGVAASAALYSLRSSGPTAKKSTMAKGRGKRGGKAKSNT